MTRRTGADATRRPELRGPAPRHGGVTIRAVRSAAAVVVLLAAGACASPGNAGGGAPAAPFPYAPDDLVLQVAVTGGFVPPQTGAGRLPLVSVYGDGRVVAEGPVAAVHPGPALPNLQVQRIDAAGV